ncbi:MAG TPA: LysM peptidoglycan-binding domain-containing M23 family metallopeptidase [Anaerolineales bacterium]|nr:LysM peptidoglycan-binding domain-containing M23 family metallopeptidase [Anaerolineales bacterium]
MPEKSRAARLDRRPRGASWVSAAGWVVALGVAVLAVYLWVSPPPALAALANRPVDAQVPPTPRPTLTPAPSAEPAVPAALPAMPEKPQPAAIARYANLLTIIPSRPRTEAIRYVVEQGDAIFSIASFFNVTPETVLWANYDLLNDNPDFLEIGMELNIPPVDGVYYQWQEGDTLESVAAEFEADLDEIVNFSGNLFDLANPVIEPGEWVMLPGGHREFRQWLIPTINRGNAGVNSAALGPGACSGSYTGPFGSGAFIWPSSNHTLSGNDYWSGHLAIDIGAVGGDPIFSSDAGVVVFTGWANGGYGYTVVVDHGNGYQTLYAHLSSVSRPCGAGVGAGTVIGTAGSTGNSTGTHLHFEVRLNGGFINPWFVLPPP